MNRSASWLCMAALAGALAAPPVFAQNLERGRLLYENHCGACHRNVVHGRAQREPQSLEQLREVVRRWESAQKLGWSAEDIEDVARYLNATHYKFE